jgi:putative transposase
MARRPRLELPGVPLHVIQRGHNRADCFYADADRRLYLACLAQSAARHGCALHAYVLMSNHVHLLVTPAAAGGVAAMMQALGRRYVRLFNDTHERTGTLWEGRFKSSLVDTESYLFNCHRYIELNPVRARMCAAPLEYRWSSHAHYRLGVPNPLVTPHPVFESLGREAFAELCRTPLPDATLQRIRESANKGWALGSEAFLDRVEAALGRSVRPAKRGPPFRRKQSERVASQPALGP